MEIVPFDGQTVVIAKDQPQYRSMPAHISRTGERRITCCWQLSFKEKLKLMWTGKIWHQILAFDQPLQPQLLMVDKPELGDDPGR